LGFIAISCAYVDGNLLFVADMEGYNKAIKLTHQHPDHYMIAD